jgi:hypothetical protein
MRVGRPLPQTVDGERQDAMLAIEVESRQGSNG